MIQNIMKKIAIALNPSKDKEGKILEEILLKVKEAFKDSKITILNWSIFCYMLYYEWW